MVHFPNPVAGCATLHHLLQTYWLKEHIFTLYSAGLWGREEGKTWGG